MATALGCIADDFTGATDLAGLLVRGGARTTLRLGVPDGPADGGAPVEVVALKIRSIPPKEAVGQARRAFKWLRALGTKRIYWKYCSTFDSTNKGNIGPVADLLMGMLHIDQTVHCPAFPENGRTVYMGNLFVGDQPLAESPMKDHPLTPMRDSDLTRLLAPQVTGRVGLVARPMVSQGAQAIQAELARLKAAGAAHVVADAIDDADLAAIAAACRDMDLLCGGSALAAPLPGLLAQDGLIDADAAALPPTPALAPGAIVLSGSCSAATRGQVAAYIASGAPQLKLSPLDLAERGAGEAVAWLQSQDLGAAPMLHATAAPEEVAAAQKALGVERASALVEDALGELARAARHMGCARFVVAGGETSGAVAQALGAARLEVGAEIAPGVPWCFSESGGNPVALALKSGNFGSESFFADALGALH